MPTKIIEVELAYRLMQYIHVMQDAVSFNQHHLPMFMENDNNLLLYGAALPGSLARRIHAPGAPQPARNPHFRGP